MNIREALQSHLLGTTALTALVGNRIYHQSLPQNVQMPAITWHLLRVMQPHTMGNDSGVRKVMVQIDCWGVGNDPMTAMMQVETAVKDYSGIMGGESGVTVQRAIFENEGDLFDQDMNRAGIYHQYDIWHE